jgi:hypothetical protein
MIELDDELWDLIAVAAELLLVGRHLLILLLGPNEIKLQENRFIANYQTTTLASQRGMGLEGGTGISPGLKEERIGIDCG